LKKTPCKIIFWIALAFIALTLLSLTIGQELPYEFADYRIQQKFYDIIIQGLPIAVLLTLFGTIKKVNSKTRNWSYIGLTALISFGCLVSQLFLLFSFGFGAWTTVSTIYRHKYENREIKEQLYDIGAFGYGGRRTVEIKPFLNYWIEPKPIDTMKINKNDWKLVNEQGDIKTP
jgi:membrane protease YdiL (CAAX protease family)